MIGEAEYFDAAVSDADKIQELLEFIAWCASEGNQAGTIASKLSAVLHFLRINLQMELPTSSSAYQACIERADESARCRRDPEKSASPDFVGCNVERIRIGLVLGSGRPRCLAVSRVGLFFVARSDEIFASPAGAVHPVHCLTRRDEERRGAV